MFEVGFSEILLIFGIALLVLGPNRLPKLAADLGRWAGRARAMARQLRTQLEQEVNFDPLKDQPQATPTTQTIAPPPFPAAPPSTPPEPAAVAAAPPIAEPPAAAPAQPAAAAQSPAAEPDRTHEPEPG
jgi:sec-independent protein translocase protein TatB